MRKNVRMLMSNHVNSFDSIRGQVNFTYLK